MLRRIPLFNNEIYHVYNRGVDKRAIFSSDEDSRRFVLLLHLANHSGSVNFRDLSAKYKGRSFAWMFSEENPDKSLVDVLSYCLMPNHFHLLLRQKTENGISQFMKKISTAYSMYFNTKYDHSGVLFQGRFKSQHVNRDSYLQCLFAYIHLNPLKLFEPLWKEKGVIDVGGARLFLQNYRPSSYHDYCIDKRKETSALAYNEARELFGENISLDSLLQWFDNGVFTKDRPL